MTETVNIIGAGIGGLTTALTLKQKGLNVQLFESSAEIKPVGAGIIIANNAMQVFQKLGIQDKIEKAGNKISYMKISDKQLKEISVADLTDYEKKYGIYNIAIHRGDLQKILVEEVGYDNINLSKRLSKIEKSEFFKLKFEDNTTIESKLVIGADGIKSVVRNQLFEENTLRNANQICWRGVCEFDLPEKYHNELNEAWGIGKRFGFVKISDKKVYWFAVVNSKNSETSEVNLIELFSDFHKDILQIISATNKDKIIVSDIIDLKPIKKWQSNNLCLIGDAAHAMTPNLGQGACQAIEDANVIGQLVEKGIPIEDTFVAYEKVRKEKVDKIVQISWKFGQISQWENPFAVWLRNNVLRMTPKFISRRQMNQIFEL